MQEGKNVYFRDDVTSVTRFWFYFNFDKQLSRRKYPHGAAPLHRFWKPLTFSTERMIGKGQIETEEYVYSLTSYTRIFSITTFVCQTYPLP